MGRGRAGEGWAEKGRMEKGGNERGKRERRMEEKAGKQGWAGKLKGTEEGREWRELEGQG